MSAKPLHRRGPLLCLALAVALASLSCSAVQKVQKAFGNELQIEVFIDPRLNQNAPLAVDLVFVYDKKIAPLLTELDARQWFATREQFRRDHKKGWGLSSWEWVPGQEVAPLTVEAKRGAEVGVVYANYLTPGVHREQIDTRQHLILRFGEKGFSVEPLE